MQKFRIYSKVSVAVLLLIFVLPSCTDWLSVAPENDLIKEKFWTKREDVNGALAATYNAFRDASLQSFILGEVRADMVTFSATSFGDYTKIASSDISPTNGAVNWGTYYKAINLANTLMYYDKEVLAKDKTFTQDMKDGIDAEALFIRSFAYFYLLRVWKDAPLVLEPSISDTANLFLPKNTEQELVNQIIIDLLKAKDLAYTTEFTGTDYFYGRANKYSIMTLLADVYLWSEQYQKCMDYCDSVTNSGLYSLEPYPTWFSMYYPGNSSVESIFEVQFDDNLDNQQNPIYDNMIKVPTGNIQIVPTKNITALFVKEDVRFIFPNGAIWKYKGKDNISTVTRSGNERDANWLLYRYADIILMKAEAANELSMFDEANSLVRQTMERAGIVHVDVNDKVVLRQVIQDERGREFIIEGKRWFDLLRAAKRDGFADKEILKELILSGAANVQQRAILATKINDTMAYYLPIPQHDIDYNQFLKQNPYYDR
jgi:hypothetical protein